MIEVGFIVFAITVVLIALYPLRRFRFVLGLLLLLILGVAYFIFGQGPEVYHYVQRQEQLAEMKAALQSYGGRAFVIKALKARLDHTKRSAYGWYLLGKLYASQGQTREAKAAFQEAQRLGAKD